MTSPALRPAIELLDALELDHFLGYLNDHLSDNGEGGTYFQPLSRDASRVPPERAAAFRDGLAVPVGQPGWRRLWVARGSSGQVAGHIDLRSHAERHAGHRCLLGMGVDRHHRRIGLGQRLIEHAEAWGRATGSIEWIDLQVLSGNLGAIRLYDRSGFAKVGEMPEMFRIDGRTFGYTAMAKRIGGAASSPR